MLLGEKCVDSFQWSRKASLLEWLASYSAFQASIFSSVKTFAALREKVNDKVNVKWLAFGLHKLTIQEISANAP
jgi:hypothetical protein